MERKGDEVVCDYSDITKDRIESILNDIKGGLMIVERPYGN